VNLRPPRISHFCMLSSSPRKVLFICNLCYTNLCSSCSGEGAGVPFCFDQRRVVVQKKSYGLWKLKMTFFENHRGDQGKFSKFLNSRLFVKVCFRANFGAEHKKSILALRKVRARSASRARQWVRGMWRKPQGLPRQIFRIFKLVLYRVNKIRYRPIKFLLNCIRWLSLYSDKRIVSYRIFTFAS
jgi:hypothetical protein